MKTPWGPRGILFPKIASSKNPSSYFCGNVVLDSINMAYRDEDSILYKIYEINYFRTFIMKI